MKLYFLNGSKAGEVFELRPPGISLGRETDNDVQLLIGGVSRYHAKIEAQGQSWAIRDLGSTNGTKINGKKIEAAEALNNGDIVTIGDQNIRFGEKIESVSFQAAPAAASVITPAPAPAAAPQFITPAPAQAAPPAQNVITPAPAAPLPVVPPPPTASNPPPQKDPVEADKEAHAKSFYDSFKQGNANLFDKVNLFGNKSAGASEQSGQPQGEGEKKGRSIRSNLVFYVLVIGAAVIFVAIFIMMQQSPKQTGNTGTTTTAKSASPFILSYEKQISDKDNIFYFALHVENGSATFTLDDIKTQRHFTKTIKKVNEIFLKTLEEKVRNTSFMALEPESPGESSSGKNEMRTLGISYDKNFKKIIVKNTTARASFEEVETAINEFAENYGLVSISMPVEEMLKEAERSFAKAEELFANYDADPKNLREAIKRYQLAIEMLDSFVPKPEKWDIARKKQQEAQSILDKKIKDTSFNADRHVRLKNYKEAVAELTSVMEMVDPESEQYTKARDYKIKLEKAIEQNKKK